MPNYYIDLVNGNDTNDGLGPYKAAFTSGGTTPIAVGDTVTGGTSGETAKVVALVHASGSWAGGDEAGTIYVGTPSGAFTDGEALLVGGVDLATLTANFAVSSWLTVTLGATAARIAAGDEIRIKKHVDPVSLSTNGTFTKSSKTVSLAAARWRVIDECETAWTGSANVTTTRSASFIKMGSYSSSNVIAAGFATGKIAYFDFGEGNEKDLSGYENISFWMNVSADIAAGVFRLDLCSDAVGDTPIAGHQFTINQKLSSDALSGNWNIALIKKGSALSDSVRSISIHAVSDPGAITLYFDNIIACNDLSHLSPTGINDDVWYPVESFSTDETTLYLTYNYGQATNTSAAYCVHDFLASDVAVAYSTAIHTVNDSGTLGSLINYRFGWDFSTNAQNGYTNYFGTKIGTGYGFNSSVKNYFRIENYRQMNMYGGFNFVGGAGLELKNIYQGRNNSASLFTNASPPCFSLIEGKIVLVGSGYVSLTAAMTTENPKCLCTADIYFIALPAGATPSAYFSGNSWKITGTIYDLECVQYGILFDCASAYVKKISTDFNNGGNILILGMGNYFIDHIEITRDVLNNAVNIVGQTGTQTGLGMLRVGRVTYPGDASDLRARIPGSMALIGERARICIDSIKDDVTAFLGSSAGGHWGDHVTKGQAANWGYGGTGKSLLLDPASTTIPLCYEFWLPVPAAGNYKVSMQVRKTSAAADCTMTYDVSGCGITPVLTEPVTLTDSWAEHLTASAFTTTIAGWLRVQLIALNGATTGDIGVDAIKLTAV